MHADSPDTSNVFAFVAQPLVAEGLARIVETCPDLEFLGYCTDASSIGVELERLRPRLLLADHGFGIRFLFDLLTLVRRTGAFVNVVVWAQSVSAPDRRQLLEAGARGIVEKNAPVGVLLDCLRSVAAGELWTGGRDADVRLVDKRTALRLTARERQVLALLRSGMKNREIAVTLAITAGTVKVHLMHIFEKTGVRNRHELSLQAARLLDPEPERRAPEMAPSPLARPAAAS